MNISSIVVQVNRDNYDKLVELLENSDLCDYHFGDKQKGKIIVTIEGEDVSEEIKKLTAIQAMPRVIAADMMQTYQEDMLSDEIAKLEAADPVPAMLNDDTIEARDIVYNGDLKKKNIPGIV
ncbi:MAG TPA: nitrate reductase [Sulfurovum sp.]|nr:nitrate reductase [Sulfurovum sp.]